jgi:hypothetical protein
MYYAGGPLTQGMILQDIAAISDGTMATLTGKTLYAEVSAIQLDWFNWTEAQVATAFQFQNWMDAWQKYQEANRVR